MQIPALFERIPPGLFGPLSSPYAPLYWDILARFYQLEFERDPFILTRGVALDVAEELVGQSAMWRDNRDGLVSEAAAAGVEPDGDLSSPDEAALLRSIARRLVGRLEQSGWYHYEYRSTIGHVLNFYPAPARILETLVRAARDEQPVFQGYAHAIASVLKAAEFGPKPGVSLAEAKRNTLSLLRELKILDQNIYDRTRHLLGLATTAGVLEESIERYGHAVQANYHRLKTVYNLFKWRGEILERLAEIERDPGALDRGAAWYADEFQLDRAAARRLVDEDLQSLRSQFESLPILIDDIDTRNARFTSVANRKIRYLLRQDTHIEGQLQFLLEQLGHDRGPDHEVHLFRCELLGEGTGFLYVPPKRRTPVAAQRLERRPKADANALRRMLVQRLRARFSRREIEAFVQPLLAGTEAVPLAQVPLANDDDYIRLINVAGYGLDGRSDYRFDHETRAPRETRGIYRHPAGRLRRVRKRGA